MMVLLASCSTDIDLAHADTNMSREVSNYVTTCFHFCQNKLDLNRAFTLYAEISLTTQMICPTSFISEPLNRIMKLWNCFHPNVIIWQFTEMEYNLHIKLTLLPNTLAQQQIDEI